MRNIINFVFFFLLCAVCLTDLQAQSTRRPNIIVILADDLAYADIEGYGSGIKTPNLVALQNRGMKFTSFYAQPQCSPSRAALLTGCYPQRVGIPWVVGPEGPEWTANKYFVGLHPDEQTLPEILKGLGYRTACIGKWHLGHHPPNLPTRHGFDYYWGIPYSNDMWPPNLKEWPELPLVEGEKTIAKNPDQRLLTRNYTEKAVAFIEEGREDPFFLYLAHTMPHVPIFASKKFKGKSGHGLYGDVIQELDWSTGEIINALRRKKLLENTIVIFTSDNGPWLRYGDHAGSAGIFREGKATTFEGGVRVPMIASWPGKIPAGTENNQIAALIDLVPTFLELFQVPPLRAKIDGRSLLPALLGKGVSARNVHYYFQIEELQAVRKGKWKLHLPHKYDHVISPGVRGQKGATETRQIELSLFNLENDPSERNNVAAEHPDVVAELQGLADAFAKEMATEKREAGNSLTNK